MWADGKECLEAGVRSTRGRGHDGQGRALHDGAGLESASEEWVSHMDFNHGILCKLHPTIQGYTRKCRASVKMQYSRIN